MKPITSATLAAVLILIAVAGCSKRDDDDAGPPPNSNVRKSASGESSIALDEPAQQEIGLKSEPIAAAQVGPELKGYGQVVDPAQLVLEVGDFIAARSANETSQAELKRLKTLAAQDNASEHALQAAEAAAAHDTAQFESAHAKLLANWGAAVVERPDLSEFLRSLASQESALVRIDVSAGEAPESPPRAARLIALSGGQVTAGLVGAVPAVDPRTQSRGFLFLVPSNAAKFAPGSAVTGYLQTSGEPQAGFIIPRSSIIRHEGAAWIYLQTNGTNFVRRVVVLDHPLENGWFVTGGVRAGDPVVVTGAQAVFSEELKASGFSSEERD